MPENVSVQVYQLKVENGLVVVPGGVKYRILALPAMNACSPEMVACVAKLRDAGATVVWSKKPMRAPGLKWGPDGDAKVRATVARLFPMRTTSSAREMPGCDFIVSKSGSPSGSFNDSTGSSRGSSSWRFNR